MTIPSTKASTTNVDAGADKISLARPDIKQNIDNVNEIIDHLDTGEWTNQQYINLQTLTDAATIAWNLDSNQVAQVTLGGNRTLGAPTNQNAGATYVLIVKQPAGANYTLSFNSTYKFTNGNPPTITASNGAIDILTFISDGTNMYGGYLQDFS